MKKNYPTNFESGQKQLNGKFDTLALNEVLIEFYWIKKYFTCIFELKEYFIANVHQSEVIKTFYFFFQRSYR